MDNCIFCKIAKHEIDSNIIYENEDVIAFHDLNPVAKVHVLIVPKTHFANIYELGKSDEKSRILSAVSEAITKVAEICDTADCFRVVVNNGEKAGQSVFHLHFHLIGGQELPTNLL